MSLALMWTSGITLPEIATTWGFQMILSGGKTKSWDSLVSSPDPPLTGGSGDETRDILIVMIIKSPNYAGDACCLVVLLRTQLLAIFESVFVTR